VKICPVCATEYPDDIKFCQNDGTTLRAAAPAANLVGQVVADRYHVVKKLGEGGMGQVYLAEHVKMGRRSAIKVMNPSMVHDPDALARFNREAANASRITHPNVCAIYDFGETPDGMIYLAMEFIEGEPLTAILERDGALGTARAVQIFLQVADALQAAHDLGIVHRDLKPDNIMISRGKGGRDLVKVVDFGIAKAVGGDDAGQKVTKTGLVVGTPEFMSPEQLSGDKVDGRSDLYALALVFFRMLTGKLPFEANTVQETMIKRLTDEPTKLATARPDVVFPTGLQEVLATALTRSPVDRYQTVAKFAENVATVTGAGRPAAAAIPRTRADSDAETQLLDGAAAQATAAKVRKRSVVPIAVGAVVVLGAVGAGIAVLGRKDGTGAVRSDTANRAAAANTTATKRPAPGGSRGPLGDPHGGNPTATRTATPVDPAKAQDALDDLFLVKLGPTTARMVLDSARRFYDAAAVSVENRAYAAFVIGNAYSNLSDRRRFCDWVDSARTRNPGKAAYQTAYQQCQ